MFRLFGFPPFVSQVYVGVGIGQGVGTEQVQGTVRSIKVSTVGCGIIV